MMASRDEKTVARRLEEAASAFTGFRVMLGIVLAPSAPLAASREARRDILLRRSAAVVLFLAASAAGASATGAAAAAPCSTSM